MVILYDGQYSDDNKIIFLTDGDITSITQSTTNEYLLNMNAKKYVFE